MVKIEHLNYSDDPAEITTTTFDCIWVVLKDRKDDSPIVSPLIQWLDWKLRGQITKLLMEGNQITKTVVFPTVDLIDTPYVCLHHKSPTLWKDFSTNCTGQKWKSVLVVNEQGDDVKSLESELQAGVKSAFPEQVFIVSGVNE